MSDQSRCYLCDKSGKFDKLFRSCKHESACHDCLRDLYVTKAANKVSLYPLKCFHPDCQLLVRSTQMERLVKSKEELQHYHYLQKKAKMNKTRLGNNWRDLLQVVEALDGREVCRCPNCQMLMTKTGGCHHMTCLCGTAFNWVDAYLAMEEKLHYHVPGILKQRRTLEVGKKKHLPTLAMGSDTDDNDDELEQDFGDDDGEYQNISNSNNFDSSSNNNDAAVQSSEYCAYFPTPTQAAALPLNASIEDHTAEEVNFETDSEDTFDTDSEEDDDWWQHAETDEKDELGCNTSQSSWEEVSEVASVHSFHSKTGMSFLEVARLGPNESIADIKDSTKTVAQLPQLPRKTTKKSSLQQPNHKHEPSDSVDEMSEQFDADFMLDGQKGSRGGKQKFKYKRQPQEKYSNYSVQGVTVYKFGDTVRVMKHGKDTIWNTTKPSNKQQQ
ncbi:MAG: hypothetical protein SGBAC_007950 [Bacillariaceae sp.]